MADSSWPTITFFSDKQESRSNMVVGNSLFDRRSLSSSIKKETRLIASGECRVFHFHQVMSPIAIASSLIASFLIRRVPCASSNAISNKSDNQWRWILLIPCQLQVIMRTRALPLLSHGIDIAPLPQVCCRSSDFEG
jgi:hypothetical protein